MKKQFLQEMEKNEDVNQDAASVNSSNNNISNDTSTRRHDEDDSEADLEFANSSVTWHGLQNEEANKFPNFPTGVQVSNRTPRDYSTAAYSSTMSGVSTVTPPPYQSPNSVSTPQGIYFV